MLCAVSAVGVVDLLAVVAGLALVLVSASDAVSTLVTTWRRLRPALADPGVLPADLCAWVALGRRAQPELREGFLAVYGSLSLLGLLVTWVVLLVMGWAAVWWGLRSAVTGVDGYLDAVYFAACRLLQWLRRPCAHWRAWPACWSSSRRSWAGHHGPGHRLPASPLRRLQPAEVQLLVRRHDDEMRPRRSGSWRTTAMGVLAVAAAFHRVGRGGRGVRRPRRLSAMFRSCQPGQNWLTALGVVLDAATICLAAVDSPGRAGGAAVAAGLQDAAELWDAYGPAPVGRGGRYGQPGGGAVPGEAYERLRGSGCRCTPTSRPGPSSCRLRELPTSPGC